MNSEIIQKAHSLKVVFKDQTRRLQLSDQNFNFSSLKQAIADLIPSIQDQPFLIQWFDDEVISLDSKCNDRLEVLVVTLFFVG